MSWPPHLTVATIVENDHKFLIVEELSSNKTVFNQPAGHVEPNESVFDAAVRETLEETQWRVELTHYIGTYVYRSPDNGVTYLRLCFAASPLEFVEQSPLDHGIIAAHWLTLDSIRSKKDQLRSPLVSKCIEDYIAGKRFPLETIYEHRDT